MQRYSWLLFSTGERSGRGIATDAITTPIVNTSAYMFKDTAELIAFKVYQGIYSTVLFGVRGTHITVKLISLLSFFSFLWINVIFKSFWPFILTVLFPFNDKY